MDIVHHSCAGIDIHKRTLVACVLTEEPHKRPHKEMRTFATHSAELERARDWLLSLQVTHVAMESTGVYWKPVYDTLEGHVDLGPLLVSRRREI